MKTVLGLALTLAMLGCGSAHESAPAAGASAIAGCDTSSDDNTGAPQDLACTGLYTAADLATVSPNVQTYVPSTPLWSDGADKQRYLFIPAGQTIDTSDPNAWVFPVGTKAWKEFTVAGQRIETRFFEKVADDKWERATYVWTDDESHAKREDSGVVNARGTGFDIPKLDDCDGCHEGRKDRLLGVDAIGLGGTNANGGVTLATLVGDNRLSNPPTSTTLPFGDATSAAAFGWLHVNCGVACHNENENAKANATGLRLKLMLDPSWNVSADQIMQTTVGVTSVSPGYDGTTRILAGDPDDSLLVQLISARSQEPGAQMPPIGTNVVDNTGVAAIRAWIKELAPPKKYPPNVTRAGAAVLDSRRTQEK